MDMPGRVSNSPRLALVRPCAGLMPFRGEPLPSHLPLYLFDPRPPCDSLDPNWARETPHWVGLDPKYTQGRHTQGRGYDGYFHTTTQLRWKRAASEHGLSMPPLHMKVM